MNTLSHFLAAAAGALWCAAAGASAVTNTYEFAASGFGPGAPADPLSGSITLSFDPALPVSAAAIESITLDIGTHPFTTADVSFGFNGLELFMYGTLNGTALLPGSDDFLFEGVVDSRGDFTSGLSFTYTSAGSSASFSAGEVTVRTPVPVPEPGTLWLLGVGLPLLLARAVRARRA